MEARTMKCTKTQRQDAGCESDNNLSYTPTQGMLLPNTQTMDDHQLDEDFANTMAVQPETSDKTVRGVRNGRASAAPRCARRNCDDSDEHYKPGNPRGS